MNPLFCMLFSFQRLLMSLTHTSQCLFLWDHVRCGLLAGQWPRCVQPSGWCEISNLLVVRPPWRPHHRLQLLYQTRPSTVAHRPLENDKRDSFLSLYFLFSNNDNKKKSPTIITRQGKFLGMYFFKVISRKRIDKRREMTLKETFKIRNSD